MISIRTNTVLQNKIKIKKWNCADGLYIGLKKKVPCTESPVQSSLIVVCDYDFDKN